MTQAPPALTLRSVSVGHAKRVVLSEVSCTIACGEVVVLVGRNGAGKTTLLRALAGLTAPLRGELRWFGASALPSGSARARTLGVVLQHEPAPSLTVRQVLGLSGSSESAIDACLAEHRLQRLAHRRVSELSGGERQRVALARAAVAGPKLYVLDEPTNHLDRVEQREFGHWLARARVAAAIVVATHSSALLASADRLLHVAASTGRANLLDVAALRAASGELEPALDVLLERDV